MSSANDPIIISGAGPGGLFAANIFKREGIPFILVERASRDSLLSNVGAAFDIAPTAVRLFRRFDLPFEQRACWKYRGAHFERMDGRVIKEVHMSAVGHEPWAAQRSTLMGMLVDALGMDNIRCGAAVKSFEENDTGVTVSLVDGSTVSGSALLAFDGIKSAVRQQMYTEADDPMHYCGIIAWWGIADWEQGDSLDEVIRAAHATFDGDVTFIHCLGDSGAPGTFFATKSPDCERRVLWCFFAPSAEEPGQSDDLRRRGGVTGDEAKDDITQRTQNHSEMIRRLVAVTPAKGVTRVGLYDREKLDLPYVSKGGRVALLGDAAHPQGPFLGMGVNMALTDAFVAATRLTKQDTKVALAAYDSAERKAYAKKTIEGARWYGGLAMSSNPMTCFVSRQMMKFLPPRLVAGGIISADDGNKDFVDATIKDLNLEP